MKSTFVSIGMAAMLCIAAQAQSPNNIVFQPGKLAVLRGGNGVFTFSDRRFPAYIDEYDPAITNQTSPIMSVALPTNGVNAMWFNMHAGSEGQGITLSADRQYIAVTGYHGDLTNITSTPSSATDCTRGFGIIDAFTNFNVTYQSQDWFGIEPGITQNNPRGIATDGTNNFWGCGTIAGTQTGGVSESGTLFWNNNVSDTPELVQSIVNSAYYMKIVNGVLYMVAKQESGGALNNGIYNFVDFAFNGGAPVPLPWAPGPDQVQHAVETNLFLNFGSVNGSTVSSVLSFDMDPSNTTVYAADNNLGIVKYVNTAGTWNLAYVFGPTNLGTANQPSGNQGCFGVAVDFSGTNPIVYATTMEAGDSKGDVSSNRLVCIVDNGNPGTNLVVQTLAVANGPNEGFRGITFTPNLNPSITLQPSSTATATNVPAGFTVSVASVYALSYQWQENGTNISDNSDIVGSTSNVLTFVHPTLADQGNYYVIATNAYGAVTSAVVNLSVSAIALPPVITNVVKNLTNYIGATVSFSVKPQGTPEFTYQWYYGSNPLTDGPNPDNSGSGYSGSTNSTLTVTNIQLSDAGNYYVVVSNSVSSASNQIAALTVIYQPPSIPSGGQPVSVYMLVGQTNSLSVSTISGTPPFTYQWYQGGTNPVTMLANAAEFSGVTGNTLTINGAGLADATNYFCVVANNAGAITSQLASVTVIVPPSPSYVGYSNQVYTQNFDSLPDPGLGPTVNTVGGGGPVTIPAVTGTTYSLANPFDFAFPVYFPNGNVDGLGLANTMSGWYGECDADTTGAQLGASWGDQTTGGIISYGLTNSLVLSSNRALGLIATSTSGGTHFGLKLVNETTSNLNYITIQFTGEYWKLGTKPKTLAFGYTVDSTGSSSPFLANGVIQQATNNQVATLSFGSNIFPLAAVGPTNGTLAVNQTNMAATNLVLSTAWTPGSALWLVWSINDPTGSGQGFGIDNLSFSASVNPVYPVITPINITPGSAQLTGIGASKAITFSFTNATGLSFSVLGTNNIAAPKATWPVVGTAVENPAGSGQYQFTDPSPDTNTTRFYLLRQP